MFKDHQAMKARMEKNETELKDKDKEIQKINLKVANMEESLKRKQEKLELTRKKAFHADEVRRGRDEEMEALQTQIVDLKSEMDGVEAELNAHVNAKMMHQYLMSQTSSQDPQKDIDFYLEWIGRIKDLIDTHEGTKGAFYSPE